MTMTLEELNSLVEELFPVRSELTSLELAAAPAVCRMPAGPRDSEDGLRMTVRLFVWDRSEENAELSIRDVKEQELYVGPASLLQRGERLETFFRGYCAALQQVLDSGLDAAALMPHELWRPEVLKLARAQTAEDFCRALLLKSRLGRFLPRP